MEHDSVFGALGFWILLLVIVLVAWTRYLQHKETIETLKRQAEPDRVVWDRQIVRLRKGLLLAVGLLAMGAGLGAGLAVVMGEGLLTPEVTAPFVGLAVFFFALGAGTLLLHILWMRQASVAPAAEDEQPEEPAEPEQ
jgi:hypothetical protein